tara:strand:+ start:168536 stop:170893 length:2358 start_codon:yes stop_codon:yes gene_type:complete
VKYFHSSDTSFESPEHQALQVEIVRMLYASNVRSFIVSIIVAATLVYVEIGTIKNNILWGWITIFIIIYSTRHFLSRAYYRQQDRDQYSNTWLKRFRIATTFCGIAWGLAGYYFYQASQDMAQQAFMIFVLVGVSGGAVITYAIDSTTAKLFAGSLYILSLPSLLLSANIYSIPMAAMLALYIIYVSISGESIAKKLHENMLMRITAYKQEEKIKLLAERQKLHIDLTPMGVIEWDSNFKVIAWNSSAEQIFGYSADEVMQMHVSSITPLEEQNKVLELMHGLFQDGTTQNKLNQNLCKNGETIYCEWMYTPLKDKNNMVIGLATLVQDKTTAKKNQDEINYLACYDLLTSLPNRRLLMERMEQALISSKRSKSYGAILFIDLDNFKNLNDLYGHQIGDLLLQEVARRLKTTLREEDTTSRFGGDEFVLILENRGEILTNAIDSTQVVVDKILTEINKVYILEQYQHRTSCSIGVCMFQGKKLSINDIFKRADVAMFQAKKAGRNGMQFFNENLQPKIEFDASLASDLQGALFNVELVPYYQAQVNHQHEVIGAELLLRWIHPKHGLISPDKFIPIAEKSNIINVIGLFVLRHACHQIKAWQSEKSTQDLRLSVNISARHFGQDNFVDEVKAALNDANCSPHLLRLELTESLMQKNVDDLAHKMQLLKDIGISLSLDDFGTGYSSLSVLRNFPLDELKIDRSFVINMLNNQSDAAIIEMIIAISNNLGMKVIAEGVETIEQETFLRDAGCLNYQGYRFSRPVPLDEFEQQLKLAQPYETVLANQY